ncbi:MAG: DNA-directed RNA polymerase subunit D [Candidatus Rehaiarchaeum fermentans]|nr:DNA-directed RNA polymerase subunit D [Candidatus Rehaiarchaeum fermentans]
MEAKLLSKKDNEELILLEGFSTEIVNSIRRAIIRSVPTMTIEDVTIYKNSSSMYNEVLAQRLGLIPLKVSGNKDEYKFKLQVKGEKTVYSGDIIFEEGVKPVYDKMIIVKLKEGEEINLEGTITKGVGEDHAKFIPAYVTYRFKPRVKILGQPKDPKKIAEICPTKVFSVSNNKLEIKNEDDCILCMKCSELDENISIEADEKRIILDIETYGSLTNKEIIDKAIDNLAEELKALDSKIKNKN